MGVGGVLWSCAQDLDTKRAARPSLSAGEEIYNEFCNRIALEELPSDVSGEQTRHTCMLGYEPTVSSVRLQTLHDNRLRLIQAIDYVLAGSAGSHFNELLKALIPLYDSGEPQAQVRAVADVLRSFENSPEALSALARLMTRDGYRPLEFGTGLIKPVVSYPHFSELMITADNLFKADGSAHESLKSTLLALQHSLSALRESNDSGEASLAQVLQGLLLKSHVDFSDGTQRYVVRRDKRGIAVPRILESGSWDRRFSDQDGDGLADVSSQGQFVDDMGLPNGVNAPFYVPRESSEISRDASGRLLTGTGELVYEYTDASMTFGAALLQESRHLLGAENVATLFDLVHPVAHLLGTPSRQTHTFLSGDTIAYDGFKIAESPLLDVAHLGAYLANTESTYDMIRLTESLFKENEREIARIVQATDWVAGWANEPQYEEISAAPNNNFFDDVVEVVAEIAAVPGLAEELVGLLGTAAVRPLGAYFGKFMRYADQINLDPENPNAPPSFNYTELVNRTVPDVGGNRSIFQRFLHLIHDTQGTKICNKEGATLTVGPITYPFSGDGYAACELFEVEDMSVFYLKSILGVAELEFKDPLVSMASNLDFLLESMSGLEGFTKNPTYQAVNRFVFGDRNEFLDNLVDGPFATDGGAIRDRHPGTIFAWEEPEFINAMKPVLWKFHEAGREDLFIKLMGAMHMHWATAQSDTTQSTQPEEAVYSYQSGIVQFEDIAARALDDADMLNRFGDLVVGIGQTEIAGINGRAILVEALRQWFVPELNGSLRTRQGMLTVFKNDGVTVVNQLAPIWLALSAVRNLDRALGEDVSDRDALKGVLSIVSKQLLQVGGAPNNAQFENRRGYAMAIAGIEFASERFGAHYEAGDVTEWASAMTENVSEVLGHPLSAALVNVVDNIVEDVQARRELERFLEYMVDELNPNGACSATLMSAVDTIQIMADESTIVPVLKAASVAFDPDRGAARRVLDFMGKANPYDSNQVMPQLLKRLVSPQLAGRETPLEVIWDVAGQVNRFGVGSDEPFNTDDVRSLVISAREFLEDDSRGLERIFDIIENR